MTFQVLLGGKLLLAQGTHELKICFVKPLMFREERGRAKTLLAQLTGQEGARLVRRPVALTYGVLAILPQ